MTVLRCAVVGMGFMGSTHAAAYVAAGRRGLPCELIAVVDRNESRWRGTASGNIENDAEPLPDNVRGYAGLDELIEGDAVDLVSVCTPTDTHAEIVERLLRAGKHALCEKPVTLSSAAAHALAAVEKETGRVCVPAMCVRYWPGYEPLIGAVRSGEFGALKSLSLSRKGAAPSWSPAYADAARSGDALFDLHVHDADLVHYLLGKPAGVHAYGDTRRVSAAYRYNRAGGPPSVLLEGWWSEHAAFPFRMGYSAEFEHAAIEFDTRLDPALTVARGDDVSHPDLEPTTGWARLIEATVTALAAGSREGLPTLQEAAEVIETLERERDLLAQSNPR